MRRIIREESDRAFGRIKRKKPAFRPFGKKIKTGLELGSSRRNRRRRGPDGKIVSKKRQRDRGGKREGRSLINKRKRRGPRTEP